MSRALGRYELLRPLARGGMGEVYLARRRAAGVEKWLVVKRMRPERVGDARFLDLFQREAKLSMSLAHQNIVPVFDFGRIDDQVFLAMERVEGKDLGSTLARSGKPLPAMLAAFVAAECCQALDYAHRRKGPDGAPLGIVHRDVTPRNVLLSWSGEVKLTDFGIASLASDAASKMAGTPGYMAPEQARGEALDPRADVYAVGMVLRETLTGERPRKGADREATVALAREGTLDPWPDGFESPLRVIVDRATASTPDERFPDARSLLEALDEFIVGERSGRKSDAPARQLAAWLAEVWEGARDDEPIDEREIEAGQLFSFLDDGALDVVGTGTQRSMAATAMEEAPIDPTRDTSPAGAATREVRAPTANHDVPAAQLAEPSPAERPAGAGARARSKTAAALVGIALVGGVAFAAWRLVGTTPSSSGAKPDLQPGAPHNVLGATAPRPAETKPPGETTKPPGETTKPPGEATKPPGEATKPPRGDSRKPPKLPKELGSAAGVEPARVVTRKVTINTQPSWSYYTVDQDKTKYQSLETIELTPGPHKIHFTGNQYFPADKTITIEVPDRDGFKHLENLEQATTPDP